MKVKFLNHIYAPSVARSININLVCAIIEGTNVGSYHNSGVECATAYSAEVTDSVHILWYHIIKPTIILQIKFNHLEYKSVCVVFFLNNLK